MKKKIFGIMMMTILMLTACGNKETSNTKTDTTVETIESTESVESTERPVTEVMEVVEPEEVTYIEHTDWFEIEKPDRSNKSPIDETTLVENRNHCTLNKSIDVYDSTGVCIGYTKENIEVYTIDNNEEWTSIALTDTALFVKTKELEQVLESSESATGELITPEVKEVTTTQVEKTVYAITDTAYYLGSAKNTAFGINPDLKVTLVVGEAYQVIEETSTGWYKIIFKDVAQLGNAKVDYSEIYVEKKCFSDTKDGTSNTSTESTKVETQTPTTQSVETLVEEKTQPTQTTKYTAEEAVAIYRSIMEANGIVWDPTLPSDGASWGTGFLPMNDPELAGNMDAEAYHRGDSAGTPWERYYIEVTGTDVFQGEPVVCITAYHS